MGCEGCPLQRKGFVRNLIVRSPLAIVGEAPGRDEVRVGAPFVGPSGAVLRRLFEIFKIRGNAVSIINAIQCFLPNKDVIKNVRCHDRLFSALEKASPKVVITLGETATSAVLKRREPFSKLRGSVWPHDHGFQVIPTYHPAYLLRKGLGTFNGQNAPEEIAVLQAFELAVNLLKGNPLHVEEDFEDSKGTADDVRDLLRASCLALDTEYRGNTLLCIGFSGSKGKAAVFTQEEIQLTKPLLESDIPKIVAFRPADESVLAANGLSLKGPIYDVLTMAHVLNENLPKYSLEEVCNLYTPFKDIKKGIDRSTLDELPEEDLIAYNGRDCRATLWAFEAMLKELHAQPSLLAYYHGFVMPAQDMFSQMVRVGLPVDLKELVKSEKELVSLSSFLHRILVREIPKSLKEKYGRDINLARNSVVSDYLFKHPDGLKLKAERFTVKTNEPALTEDHLKQFASKEWVKQYLTWKKTTKLVGTYIKNIYEHVHPDGRLRPIITFTATGRTAMSRPNLQNIPKHSKLAGYIRRTFRAPEGYSFIAVDLSQSEIRIMGWLAKEKRILSALHDGVDLHRLTASIVSGKPQNEITKEERFKAKAVNFGFLYGMSAKKFQSYAADEYGVHYTQKEAEEVRARFFEAYPALQKFHQECINTIHKQGWIAQPLGRRRRLPEINSDDPAVRSKAERQAINFPIQAFSTDLAVIGMFLATLQSVKISPVLFIHDETIFLCKDEDIPEALEEITKAMTQDAVQYIKDTFKVSVGYPVEVEAKVGKSLAEMKEVDYGAVCCQT